MEDMLSFQYRKLLTKHSQLLHTHGMDVDEEMRSLSLSEDEDSIVSAAGSDFEVHCMSFVFSFYDPLSYYMIIVQRYRYRLNYDATTL